MIWAGFATNDPIKNICFGRSDQRRVAASEFGSMQYWSTVALRLATMAHLLVVQQGSM